MGGNLHSLDIIEIDTILQKKLSDSEKSFYFIDTIDIIEQYKKILDTPVNVSFFNDSMYLNKDVEQEKKVLSFNYINTISDLLEKHCKDIYNTIVSEYIQKQQSQTEDTCHKCHSRSITESTDFQGIFICTDCGTQENIGKLKSSIKISHNDSERVNICFKYTYEKKSHFLNCMDQFQGKSKNDISEDVINQIVEEMQNYNLTKENVTKEHILLFIKDLKLTKYYGEVNIIYSKITGKKLHNISHLYEKLKQDFEIFVKLHYKLYPKERDRKNFNYQQLLFQLLSRHKYPCSPNDFNFLKTIERKSYHEDICKSIFEELGWNYTSLF